MFLWPFLDYPTYDSCMLLSTLTPIYQSTWHPIPKNAIFFSTTTETKISHRVEPVITISGLQHLIYSISYPAVPINSTLLTTYSSVRTVIYNDKKYSVPFITLGGGADKSLARPGRKQATVTKLGIYSTYSPRSSMHFLARCSNFCKQLKKNTEICLSSQVSAAACRTKNGDLSSVFSVQGTGSILTGPDPENRVGDQDIGSPCRPVSFGLQVPGEPRHCRARTRPSWWPSRGVFPSKCLSVAPAEMSNTPHW